MLEEDRNFNTQQSNLFMKERQGELSYILDEDSNPCLFSEGG